MSQLPAQLDLRFREAMAAAFGPDAGQVDPLIRASENPQFGDYQANVAMSLARRVGRKPRDVAEAIVRKLDLSGLCEEPQIAGPGFINLRVRNEALVAEAARLAGDPRLGVALAAKPQAVVVDYSGPNVAKEMHVGHVRSTIIGDALVRVLEHLGHRVIRQNHLGDWGTQFGMLIEHLNELGLLGCDVAGNILIQDLDKFYKEAKVRFDSDPDFADRARRRVVELQAGEETTLRGWKMLVEISKMHFQPIYQKLGVLLTEDDVRGESAYNDALAGVAADLEKAGVAKVSDGALCVFVDKHESPLMVRKADGGFGYDATDLAALRYRVQELHADRLIYVTDNRQVEHFDKVFHVARLAGWARDVTLEHVIFGTILGEDGKPFKTRSGETVKLADLLGEAQQRAAAIVSDKNPDLPEDERRRVAHVVGIGAIKYADLCNDRRKDYVFSWDRMLAMEGNTSPYLQYAYARIRSIFRKADSRQPTANSEGELVVEAPQERALVLKLMQLPQVVGWVADKLEPHHLCTYLYELSAAFSAFYESCPVLKAEDETRRRSRLALCDLTARALQQGLNLLGIEVLDRM